jgi:starvation-inducible DNA-binding protein
VFYQRLRTYHWNVSGPHFFDLHVKFEELYTQWALNIDAAAERVLTIGGKLPATLADMIAGSRLEEHTEIPDGAAMVRQLIADGESILGRVNEAGEAAAAAGDSGSVAFLDGLREAHEKDLWMLRAWLG